MANVVIGEVSAALMREGGVEHEYEEVGGDRARMEDGSLRSSVKTRKNLWHMTTTLMSEEDAAALEAAIVAAPPVSCSGDALGDTYDCVGEVHSRARVPVRGGLMFRVVFSLYEI